MLLRHAVVALAAAAGLAAQQAALGDDDDDNRGRRLAGRWAFAGTQTCLSSSTGFQDNLLPRIVFPAPQGIILSVSTSTVSGVRVFNADKTGTSTAVFHTVTHPTDFIPGTGSFRSGGASATTLATTFTYDVQGDTVVIDDDSAPGVITKGASVGATVQVFNLPKFVGKISKDRRSIAVMHDDVAVEQNVFTPLVGSPTSTDRICNRVRTLYRID